MKRRGRETGAELRRRHGRDTSEGESRPEGRSYDAVVCGG